VTPHITIGASCGIAPENYWTTGSTFGVDGGATKVE